MTIEQPIAENGDSELLRKKEQKVEQARVNGRKSQGPITPEGKVRSSRNAIRHGMTANEHTVLEAESLEEYDEVRSAFISSFHPGNKAELRLVEKIANLDWRLERLAMMDTALLNLRADLSLDDIRQRYSRMDGIGVIVLSWLETNTRSGCSDLLRRYIGTLEYQYNSACANFRAMKKDRLAEAAAGDTFEKPPYQEPQFDLLLQSEIAEPPPSYDAQFGQVEPEIPAPVVNTPAPPADSTPLPNEPTLSPKIHRMPPLPKRPAA